MKGTDQFKATIKAYLDGKADTDSLFADTYAKEGKNIDDCITFMLNTIHKAGINGYDDVEIYSMAVHYYDEDDLDIGKGDVNMQVVVNHHIELTDEEKAEALKNAKVKAEEEQLKNIKKRKKVTTSTGIAQQSLF